MTSWLAVRDSFIALCFMKRLVLAEEEDEDEYHAGKHQNCNGDDRPDPCGRKLRCP
jgi:hypothetical protein